MDDRFHDAGNTTLVADRFLANLQTSEAQFETRMQALIETIDAQRATGKGRQIKAPVRP